MFSFRGFFFGKNNSSLIFYYNFSLTIQIIKSKIILIQNKKVIKNYLLCSFFKNSDYWKFVEKIIFGIGVIFCI